MNQETNKRPLAYEAAAEPVPHPKCSRCEDWTTVLHSRTLLGPCPVCRPAEYEAWLATDGAVLGRAGAA